MCDYSKSLKQTRNLALVALTLAAVQLGVLGTQAAITLSKQAVEARVQDALIKQAQGHSAALKEAEVKGCTAGMIVGMQALTQGEVSPPPEQAKKVCEKFINQSKETQ